MTKPNFSFTRTFTLDNDYTLLRSIILKPNRHVSLVLRQSNKHTLYVVDVERCRHGWFFCCNEKNEYDYKIRKSCFRHDIYNKIKQDMVGCKIYFF